MTVAVAGLTGGIGSGKSTVASMFSELGVPVLDLDRVGKNLTGLGQAGLKALVEAFGERILGPDGRLDRKRLAAMCFGSGKETKRLNRILHPLIWQEADQWVARQNAPYVLIEASVLLESGGEHRMDVVLAILAEEEVRWRRVQKRDGGGAARFGDILFRQCSDDERLQAADIIIRNDGDMQSLRVQAGKIHAELTQRFLPCG